MATEKRFTEKQGQYLAYIQLYLRLHRRPPSEADLQHYFQVSPPSVHRMLVELQKRGLIARVPRQARTIRLLVDETEIPKLQPIKTSGTEN